MLLHRRNLRMPPPGGTLVELLLRSGKGHLLDEVGGQVSVDLKKLDFKLLSEELGVDAVALAWFGTLERQIHAVPVLTGCPTRIFISYRHDGSEIVRQVKELADFLRTQQYIVDLDLQSLATSEIDVELAKFVSLVGEADVLIPFVNKAFLESLGRPWITAEIELALLRALSADLDIVVASSQSLFMPAWLSFFPIQYIDGTEEGYRQLMTHLPSPGVALTGDRRTQARSLITQCRVLLDADRFDEMIALILTQKDLLQVTQFRELLHVAHALSGRGSIAEQFLPYQLLRTVRLANRQLAMAQHLHERGRFHDALVSMHDLLRNRGMETSIAAHLLCATILEDLDSLQGARNQFQLVAVDPDSSENQVTQAMLGLASCYFKMKLGGFGLMVLQSLLKRLESPPDIMGEVFSAIVGAAVEAAKQGDEHSAQNTVNVTARRRFGLNREPRELRGAVGDKQFNCDNCGALFLLNPLEEKICTQCTSVYLWAQHNIYGNCPFCGHTGFLPMPAPDQEVLCPLCRTNCLEVSSDVAVVRASIP